VAAISAGFLGRGALFGGEPRATSEPSSQLGAHRPARPKSGGDRHRPTAPWAQQHP